MLLTPTEPRASALTLRSLALPALRVAIAMAALALIFVPAEWWHQASHDLRVNGFDAKTNYLDVSSGRYGTDRFQVLTNGDWQSCPCAPGTMLALVGKQLSPASGSDPAGADVLAGVTVTADGVPAKVYLVGETQINFTLPEGVRAPGTTVLVRREGTEVGRQFIPITGAASASTTARQTTIVPTQLELVAAPGVQPSVHLFTTPRSFQASFDAAVRSDGGGSPLTVMLWNPRNFGSISLVFGPAPERSVQALVNEGSGEVAARRNLGVWTPGIAYHVAASRQNGGDVEFTFAPSGATSAVRSIFRAGDAPAFFDGYRPTLTVTSQSEGGTTDTTLTNYTLELAHERFLSVRIADGRALATAIVLLIIAALLHLPLLARFRPSTSTTGTVLATLRSHWWLAPPTIAFVSAIGWLMTVGSHPFDMESQTAWTYLLVNGGLGDLYYSAQTVPIADIWKGVPYHEAVYPYGVSMSYYFFAIGWVYQLFGGNVSPHSSGLEIAIKSANFAVALVDATLIFALVRGFGRRRFAWLVPAAFLLNPAVVFDLAVWGETESVALFFLLASLLASQRGSARWAWVLLALAFLGKQTIIVPAFLTAVYYLRVFPIRRTLEGLAIAAPITLATVLPFIALGYSPSIAIDPILGAFNVFGGSDSEPVFNVVSYDSYNVWPLVTALRHGQHGAGRLQFPDATIAFGSFSYQQIGVAAFLLSIALLAVWLLTSKRVKSDPGAIFVVLSLAMMAELIFPTRSIARYLVFPIVLAIIAAGNAPRSKGLYFVIAIVTCTSFIGMFGSVAASVESNPLLAPRLAGTVSDGALAVFHTDWVITIGAVANLAALFVLGARVLAPAGALRRPALQHHDETIPTLLPAGATADSRRAA